MGLCSKVVSSSFRNTIRNTISNKTGVLTHLGLSSPYSILMQPVVPSAVRKAVSAATAIFTANSIHLFFSMVLTPLVIMHYALYIMH